MCLCFAGEEEGFGGHRCATGEEEHRGTAATITRE